MVSTYLNTFVLCLLLVPLFVKGLPDGYHQAFDCSQLENGHYPDPAGCSPHYFACVHHKAHKMNCPRGLFYDPEFDLCELKENIPVCGGHRPVTLAPPVVAGSTLHPDIFDCTENEDGYYSNPREKCSHIYYACSGGIGLERSCQENLIFDPETNVCDLPENTYECTGTRPTERPVSDAPLQSYHSKPNYPFDCATMADGLYADPTNKCSNIFYMCSNTLTTQMLCAGPTYYDVKTERCHEWKSVFDCSGQEEEAQTYAPMRDIPNTLPPVDFDCTNLEDGPHPDPKNACSNTYYVCSNHIAFERPCPLNTYWDAEESICDGYGNIFACSGIQKTTTTTTELYTSPPRIPEFDCTEKTDGFYLDHECSETYYVCSGHIDSKHTCPDGLIFDMEKQQCERFDDVFVCSGQYPKPQPTYTFAPADQPITEPVPIDCGSMADGDYPDPDRSCSEIYYSCSGGIGTKRRCAETTFFDTELLQCGTYDDVPICSGNPRTSPTPTLPPSPHDVEVWPFDCGHNADGDYPAGDCESHYWSCVGGVTLKRDCVEGLKFDAESNMCEEEHYIRPCGGQPRTPAPPTDSISPEPVYPFDCHKHPDGSYPDPEDACSHTYYVCVAGRTSRFDCPANLRFDPDRNLCDLKIHVSACGGRQTDTYGSPQQISDTRRGRLRQELFGDTRRGNVRHEHLETGELETPLRVGTRHGHAGIRRHGELGDARRVDIRHGGIRHSDTPLHSGMRHSDTRQRGTPLHSGMQHSDTYGSPIASTY